MRNRMLRMTLVISAIMVTLAGLSVAVKAAVASGAAKGSTYTMIMPKVKDGVIDNNCPDVPWVEMGNIYWNCYYGADNYAPGPGQYLMVWVANRVWLHQYSNGTGWADCFEGPGVEFVLSGRDLDAKNLQISMNGAPC